MADDLKRRSVRGVAWASVESVGVAVLSLVSFIILARMLEPQDFGVVALATVFIYFCNLLTGHGFADALVQRPDLQRDHLDTAFWSTLALSLVLLALCLVGAQPAAALLDAPQLAQVLPWLAAILPLSALCTVQMALFRRDMHFDAVAKRTLFGRGLGAAVGIAMAIYGYGLWSLVAQQLVGQLALALAFMTGQWRPRLRFSIRRFREMWGFGLNVSAAQVVTGAGEQALTLIIGAFLGTTVLGHFTIAWRAVQLIKSLVSSAVYHVGLSAFSKLRQDRTALTNAFLNATRISCLVGFPVGVGMALAAGPLILTAFDKAWTESIPLLTVLGLELVPAFYCMFLSALYRALGHPGWSLTMASLYAVTGLILVLAAAPFGISAIVAVWVARAVLLVPLHILLAAHLLDQSPGRIAEPARAPLITAGFMAFGTIPLLLALPDHMAPWLQLGILVPWGASLYVGATWLLYPELARLAWRTIALTGPRRLA